jgi:hypothetical protein
MTRLLTTGWETGDINEGGGSLTTGGNGAQTVVTSSPTPRSPGTYCTKLTASGSTGFVVRKWTLAAPATDLWVRFGLFIHGANSEFFFLKFQDSQVGGDQGTVTYSPVDNLIRVYRGVPATNLLGTSVLTFMQDAWHTVEVRWQITSTTVGTVEVWIDGTRWLNLTGVDNTVQPNAYVQAVVVSADYYSTAFPAGFYVAYDDLAINNTAGSINNGQVGDGRVVLLKPNGAGSNTALTRGGTDSGANWSQVDELPPSMTDYVYSATVGARDTYVLEDVPAGTWAVNAVEVLAYAQNSDAGAGSLGLTVKSGATTNEGTAQPLTTSAAYVRQLYETDPNTSAAWTVANVNALEAGITVR